MKAMFSECRETTDHDDKTIEFVFRNQSLLLICELLKHIIQVLDSSWSVVASTKLILKQ